MFSCCNVCITLEGCFIYYISSHLNTFHYYSTCTTFNISQDACDKLIFQTSLLEQVTQSIRPVCVKIIPHTLNNGTVTAILTSEEKEEEGKQLIQVMYFKLHYLIIIIISNYYNHVYTVRLSM